MGKAVIHGMEFPVNPESISWDYSVKLATQKTIGGKVVQLYGWRLGDLTVSGSFGRGGWRAQEAFFNHMKNVADEQAPSLDRPTPQPVRFTWAERGWDFWVYVKALTQKGASVSIETTEAMIAPKYTLTMFIAEDNGQIVQAALDAAQVAYINRLTAGLGWQKSAWNGPLSMDEMSQALQGLSPIDYLFTEFGRAQVAPEIVGDAG